MIQCFKIYELFYEFFLVMSPLNLLRLKLRYTYLIYLRTRESYLIIFVDLSFIQGALFGLFNRWQSLSWIWCRYLILSNRSIKRCPNPKVWYLLLRISKIGKLQIGTLNFAKMQTGLEYFCPSQTLALKCFCFPFLFLFVFYSYFCF